MAENADRRNTEQKAIVPNSSAAPNINPAAPEDGENATADERDFHSKLIGYRFVPTDEELIRDYLMKKVNGEPLPPNDNFHEANIYNSDPYQLSQEYKQSDGGKEWYFFSSRNRKYPRGGRPNRETENRTGFWKVTGVFKSVTLSNGTIIGYKSNLDFYLRQDPKSIKTSWKMHEYQVNKESISSDSQIQPFGDMMLDRCVLCKIYVTRTKKGGTDKEPEDEDRSSDACSSEQDVNEPPPPPPNNSSRRNYSEMSLIEASNDTNKRARILVPEPALSLMPTYVSYNQNSNASFPQLPTDGESLMPDSSKQCVDGASSMAVNNNAMYLSDQNMFMDGVSPQWIRMASSYEQAINEAPWIAGNNNTMYASTPECRNLDPMAGNNTILSTSQNPLMEVVTACRILNTSSPQVVNGESPMTGSYQQAINGADSKAGNYDTSYASSQNPLMTMGSSLQDPNDSTQGVNIGTATQNQCFNAPYQQSYPNQYSNTSHFQQDFNGASSMGNSLQKTEQAYAPYQQSYPDQYSNTSHFQQDFLAGNNQFSEAYCPYTRQDINGGASSSMAAGNYLAPKYKYSNAYPFENDFHGAFPTEGLNQNLYFWEPCPESVLYGENDGMNFGCVPVQHPNATSSQPTVSDKTPKKEGSVTQPTLPGDDNNEEEEAENSGNATQTSVGRNF